MENRLLILTRELSEKYTEIVFTNKQNEKAVKNKDRIERPNAIWIYDKNFPREKNILVQVWEHKKENFFEFVIRNNLWRNDEKRIKMSEIIKKTSNCITFRIYKMSDDELKNYLNEKLNLYYQIKGYKLPEEKTNMNETDIAETEKPFYDKNMILYGPPGTGKTYNTVNYAVAVIENKSIAEVQSENYADVIDRYNQYKTAGRIEFVTFHQSYGYEEFIEGIKPVVDDTESTLGYTIESGIFKRFCVAASTSAKAKIAYSGKIWNVRSRAGDKDVPFDYENYLYENGEIIVEDITDKNRQCDVMKKMSVGDIVVLGRDFRINAIGVVNEYEPVEIEQAPFHWKLSVDWLVTGLKLTFSEIGKTGMSVSNFAIAKSRLKMQDIMPLIQMPEADIRPYIFIIDEINRGNISKIFGELITLIEDTKRKGMPEEMSAVLPYSGEAFSVPQNVYILGTMNTADRSIALMDTALRRRFTFVEMMPDTGILTVLGADTVEDLDVAAMLNRMNERITFLYDREHTIGHAFFTKLKDAPTVETLAGIFRNKIVPLLQEYFYEDYAKIQLVLGDNAKSEDLKFIRDEPLKVREIFRGSIDDAVDLPEKKYTINEKAFLNLESYRQI